VPFTGLDHVQLAAPPGCEPDARRFYGELLGLEEIPKPEPLRSSGGIWFRIADQELHIGVEDPFTPARKAHPGLRVEPGDLDELAARLQNAGAAVDWDDRYPGVRRFYTADPFGNRIEIGAAV
jgi:catechol 2,3-dioxygenase-like lactoylglutathione lyase family enzyme